MLCCPRSPAPYLAGLAGVLSLMSQPCDAARWRALGKAVGSSAGLAYLDLDSLREEGGYRIALFLTVYAAPEANVHSIKLDRIAQETAFDCAKHRFALRSTAGYFEGTKVGGSSDDGDWKESFKPVPLDPFSQRAYELVCDSPLAAHPETIAALGDSPGSVILPAPGTAGEDPEQHAPAD